MGHFGQRIILIHELRKLRRTEKFLNRGGDRLGIDQILRGQTFRFSQAQPFLDGAFYPHQANAEGVFGHFADAADATVAKVVNIVHHAIAVANINQHLENRQNVFH